MLAIRRCRYCGELFDAEVGDSDQYCEKFLGLDIPETEMEDVEIPDAVFDLAESIDFQIEKGHPVSEKPIDDFQTGTKDTHRNAKSIFRAPKEKIKR